MFLVGRGSKKVQSVGCYRRREVDARFLKPMADPRAAGLIVPMPLVQNGGAQTDPKMTGEAPYRTSLMTSIGLAEGEVLSALEKKDVALIDELVPAGWPAFLIWMAVGSLVRAGLIRAIQFQKSLYLVASGKETISK